MAIFREAWRNINMQPRPRASQALIPHSTMVRFEKKLEDFQSFKLLSLILAVFWYIMAGLN